MIQVSLLCLFLGLCGLFLHLYLRPSIQGALEKDSGPWKSSLKKIEEGEGGGPTFPNSGSKAPSGHALLALGRRIDINRASAEELAALPGLGLGMAGRIVEDRNLNGPFERIEDLMRVAGIKEKKFAQIQAYVTVRP